MDCEFLDLIPKEIKDLIEKYVKPKPFNYFDVYLSPEALELIKNWGKEHAEQSHTNYL